jgi:uncharacterized DUF497 family protein
MSNYSFEWSDTKNHLNIIKHGVSFEEAQKAFLDTRRLVFVDLAHSQFEKRFFCIGQIEDAIVTVRFTIRNSKIRIIGAGYWRKGKELYAKKNKL